MLDGKAFAEALFGQVKAYFDRKAAPLVSRLDALDIRTRSSDSLIDDLDERLASLVTSVEVTDQRVDEIEMRLQNVISRLADIED